MNLRRNTIGVTFFVVAIVVVAPLLQSQEDRGRSVFGWYPPRPDPLASEKMAKELEKKLLLENAKRLHGVTPIAREVLPLRNVVRVPQEPQFYLKKRWPAWKVSSTRVSGSSPSVQQIAKIAENSAYVSAGVTPPGPNSFETAPPPIPAKLKAPVTPKPVPARAERIPSFDDMEEGRISFPELPDVKPGKPVGSTPPPIAPVSLPKEVAPKESEPQLGRVEMDAAAATLLDEVVMTSKGKPVRLRDFLKNKKGVMIDLWTIRSPESLASIGGLNALNAQMSPLGIQVVAIGLDGDLERAERLKNSQRLEIPWLLEGDTKPFSTRFGFFDMPLRVLIDKSGKLVFAGSPNADELRSAVVDVAED